MVEFTEELNVEEEAHNPRDWVKYRRLIERLRKKLGECKGARFSHDCPVLPSQQNPPTRWFHIVLQTNSGPAITLRIRVDNLYLDGYQVESSGQWFEFGSNPSQHLIPGSTFLGFQGSYDDLQRIARQTMDSINLGQTQLTTAVIELRTTTSNQRKARALIIMIQMICESIRFNNISQYLATPFDSSDLPSPSWMLNLEHGWGALSTALLRADADPVHGFRLPQANNNLQIRTAEEAVNVLGILVEVRCGWLVSARVPRMVNIQQGLPRVEVFSVRINNIDDENEGQLYGTITVIDGLGCQYIYNRRSDDYENIYPENDALLIGPNGRTISACDSFTINVDLKDHDTFSPDDEVSKGQISWNVFSITNKFDKPFSEVIKGKYGSATVNYIVFSNAMEAFVEVTLIDGDGENPANVYGDITARIKCFENKIMLFKKKEDEYIDVHPGGFIPLLRSKAAVPLYSSLIICAKLYDQDTISSDDEIANGNVEFPAQLYGTLEKYITGKYGKIQVKVTWINI